MVTNIDIVKSTKEGKKYDAIIHKDSGKTKTVSFGAAGMSDYTKHKDNERKSNYLSRHKANENCNDHETAAFYATRLLWNKPTLKASITDTNRKFPQLHITVKH